MMRLASWRLYFRRRSQTVGLVVMMVVLLGMVLLLSNNNNGKPLIASRELYTVQETYHKYTSRSVYYNISVIADKDKASKTASGDWGTILLNGRLTRELDGTFSIEWLESIDIVSKINEEGRGMELSDLTFFNGRLYSFDDRTGIVYEIDYERSMAIARHILVDGDGRSSSKGFKCEWSTVKDGLLYVGGLGKEWTTPEGKVKSRDPQYIKTISTEGKIEHTSWKHVYEGLREATGYENPGYLIHEAVRFNPVDRRWYFMPRRASTEVYNDEADEKRGSNIVITTNEHFDDIQLFHVGEKIPSHGFSAFAFVPHRENEVIALKTEEDEGKIATYITAFDFKTKEVLLPETKIGEVKFEGIEFL